MTMNNVLLFTSWATVGVYALQSAPSSSLTSMPFHPRPPCAPFPSVPSEGARMLATTALSSASQTSGTDGRLHVHNPGRSTRLRRGGVSSALRSSAPGGSNAMDVDIIPASSSSSSTSSFLRSVDSFGMKLKPWALRAYKKSVKYYSFSNVNGADATHNNATATSAAGANDRYRQRAKSLLCRMQANGLWLLYICYRGYRGFFVLLPAVFREVYRQLEASDVVMDAYGEAGEGQRGEQRPQSQPTRRRTSITTSVLSAVLTLSYVFSGAVRVLGKFIKTFTSTTSVESSFEAAAEEVAVNERKLRNKMTKGVEVSED